MDELKALTEAVDLLKQARQKALDGPHRVWAFLFHASEHLQKHIDQLEAIQLDPIFSDPESVSA
jgi:hypothetical protein